MNRLMFSLGVIGALGIGSMGIAGCTTTANDSAADSSATGASANNESVSPTSSTSSDASASPDRTSASPGTTASADPTTNVSAAGIADSLSCLDVVTEAPPAAARPKPASAVRCNLGEQGYIVYAYSSQGSAAIGLGQLSQQAADTGETMILAVGNTWIVKPAEGTTVGKEMLKAAKAVGGTKKTLP